MTDRLETAIIRFGWSKKGLHTRMRYLLLGLLFYPLLKTKERGDTGSQVSTAGDDVYPLF